MSLSSWVQGKTQVCNMKDISQLKGENLFFSAVTFSLPPFTAFILSEHGGCPWVAHMSLSVCVRSVTLRERGLLHLGAPSSSSFVAVIAILGDQTGFDPRWNCTKWHVWVPKNWYTEIGLTWFGEIYSYFCFLLGPARAVLSRICIPLATPLHSETLVCHIKCLFIEQFCHPVCRCTMLGPHYTPSWSGQSVGQTERDRGNKSARCVSSFFLPPLPSSSLEHFLSLWQRAMTSRIMISHRSSPAKKFDWWDRCIQEVFDIEPFLSIPWRYIFISIISDTYWWINVLVTCVQFSYDKSDFVPMKMYLHIMCICSSSLLHV